MKILPSAKKIGKSDNKFIFKFKRFTLNSKNTLKPYFKTIDMNRAFRIVSYVTMLINTLILAFDSTTLSDYHRKTLAAIDFGCMIFFFLETLWFFLTDPKHFFKETFNIIDFFLFVLNLTSLIYFSFFGSMEFIFQSDDNLYSFIRSFQIIRINRILFETKIVPGIATLLKEMFEIIANLKHFLILTLIFFLLITLMGRDLYSPESANIEHYINMRRDFARCNFQSFSKSFFSNLLMFFNEDWNINTSIHHKIYNPKNTIYLILNILTLAIFLNKFFLALLINGLIKNKKMKNLINKNSDFLKFFKKIRNIILNISKKLTKCFSKSHLSRFRTQLKKNFIWKTYIENLFENNPHIEKAMFILSCFSLILVGLRDDFQSEDSNYNSILKKLDLPIFSIFTMEYFVMVLNEKNKFFSQKIMIRFVIFVSYMLYFITNVKILKLLVLFRFVLIITHYDGLNRAVKALFLSFWDILYLFAVYFLFIFLFTTIGVKLFKGTMWKCKNLNDQIMEKIQTQHQCYDYGGDWENSDFNFDNILNGMDMLFAVANSSGWTPLMYFLILLLLILYRYQTIDSAGKGLQPILNFNRLRSIYFFVFSIVTKFFLLNILIAVFVEKYMKIKQDIGMNSFKYL